ncbi:MAG: helix-turn-helix transcriptional regulator [Anaerolineales bacterium]|nr:helix-turn-helix transcriptional regulator [Anaerolineales bacterium]
MLAQLVEDKLKETGLSLRKAADKIGIAHTTLSRAIQGYTVDVDTLIAICNWLEVSPSSVLNAEGITEDALAAKIALVVQSYPQVKEIFETALDRLEAGEVDQQAINELVSFAAFRLGVERDKK